MSEYYRLTLNFATRLDMPAPVIRALSALSDGHLPDPADLASLPPLIALYLGAAANAAPVGEGGAAWRFTRFKYEARDPKPDDPAGVLHLEQLFRDDEYANAGGYFVHWLFQFACDGHLAVELSPGWAPPTLYTRLEANIIITQLAYDPDEFATPATRRPRPAHAIIVAKTLRQPLASMVKAARDWNPEDRLG